MDDPVAAVEILCEELDYLEAIYGESRLVRVLGDGVLELRVSVLEERAQRRDVWRYRYFHLTDALSAELGDRAFDAWCTSYRGLAWRQNYEVTP